VELLPGRDHRTVRVFVPDFIASAPVSLKACAGGAISLRLSINYTICRVWLHFIRLMRQHVANRQRSVLLASILAVLKNEETAMKTSIRTLALALTGFAALTGMSQTWAAEAPVERIVVVAKRLPRAEAPVPRIVVIGRRDASRIAQANAAANRRTL
jgi:hypothetical protein